MELFWIILFLIIFALSFLLAMRSMRNFAPAAEMARASEALFLVQANTALSSENLQRLHRFLLQNRLTISFERLFKGGESALVMYGSKKGLEEEFTQWGLLELEDYLLPKQESKPGVKMENKADADHSLGWSVDLTRATRPVNADFFSRLNLAPDEQFAWQLILSAIPDKKGSDKAGRFRVQLRGLAVAQNSQDRVSLGKRIAGLVKESLGLEGEDALKPQPNLYSLFVSRLPDTNLTKVFEASAEEVKRLLGV